MSRIGYGFKSGDVLAFCGRGKESRLIRVRDLTRFSHVGFICRHGGRVLLWESTTLSNVPCSVCGELHTGVQAVDPRERIEAYDGRVWLSRLRDPIHPEHLPSGQSFLRAQHGKPYDKKQVMWAVPTLGIYPWQRYDDSAWFCSELLIAFMQRVDRVSRDSTPVAWRPCHVMRRLPRWGVLEQPVVIKG